MVPSLYPPGLSGYDSDEMLTPLHDRNIYAWDTKLWVGGNNAGDGEWEDGKVSCVVAYLVSSDPRTNVNYDDPYDDDTFQLQQWRNRNLTDIPDKWDKKWKLKSDLSGSEDYFVRKERPIVNPANDALTFNINCNKFVSGSTYNYQLISLEKLEEKLHLMSKYPTGNPTYKHIEDDLSLQDVFTNLNLRPGYNDSPIVASDSFSPSDPTETVTISPLYYDNPDWQEGEPTQISMSDFILVIKP